MVFRTYAVCLSALICVATSWNIQELHRKVVEQTETYREKTKPFDNSHMSHGQESTHFLINAEANGHKTLEQGNKHSEYDETNHRATRQREISKLYTFQAHGNLGPTSRGKHQRLQAVGRRRRSQEYPTNITLVNQIVNVCRLEVSPASIDTFNERVFHQEADAVTLLLTFSRNIHVQRLPGVILPYKWRWVYGDTTSYLRMPYSAFIWSLGLLYLHNGQPVNISFNYPKPVPKQCLNLTIGELISDKIIGNALASMTELAARKDYRYHSSQWCYAKKIDETKSELLLLFYRNFLNTRPSLGFVCCQFRSETPSERVECLKTHKYNPIWWGVPIGLGIFMLLYFPLIFLQLNGVIHERIKKSNNERTETWVILDKNSDSSELCTIDESKKKSHKYVYLTRKSPITAWSLILSALRPLAPAKQSTKSRITIFVCSLFTLLIPGIEMCVYYIYLYDYVVDMSENDITVSWTSMIVGWDGSRKKLDIFGGQYIALSLYLLLGWVIMLIPKVMADELYIAANDDVQESMSVLKIRLLKKETLGSLNVRKCTNGYKRLRKLQMCHIYMLVNPDFWKFVAYILKMRWCSFLEMIRRNISNRIARYVIVAISFPFYFILSLSEIILSIIFYSVPMISLMFYVLKGFCVGLNKYLEGKCCGNFPRMGIVFRLIMCTVLVVGVLFHLYIFTLLFMHSFIFISRISMFTFTALVAYPMETYGYFMFVLLSTYFGLEGIFRFGDIYRIMLKSSVNLCKQDEDLSKYLHKYKDANTVEIVGIAKELFEFLVESIRPRRVQVLRTIIKLASMVFVLSVSIKLLEHFKRFEQLSLLVHIFITVFICAIPAIYTFLVEKDELKIRVKMKVRKHLRRWLLKEQTSLELVET